jgi:cbb3-type cytochrome oxidase maturation protein
MNILILTVPMAILISAAFAAAFLWAVKSGQFEDLETPSHRALYDEH